jgi:uncharacterized membrane protein YdbT with pleckstrin-like domain
MFCTRCGKDNPDDAAFCYKCGREFEQEDETRVAKRPEAPLPQRSAPIFSISPTIKFVLVGYLAAMIGAFLLVAILSVFVPAVPPILAVLMGMLLLTIPAVYHIRKKLVRYTLTDTMIEIDRGLISRTTQNIPLRRIQDVTVTCTFFQRILGYGDIEVDNASDDAAKIILDDIDSPKKYAAMVLDQMREVDR